MRASTVGRRAISQAISLSVCPSCKAAPGQQCVDHTGRRYGVGYVHHGRWQRSLLDAQPAPSPDVWLDDVRPPPGDWHWVRTVGQAIEVLKARPIKRLSLDHDLGPGRRAGYHLVLYMAETGNWPKERPVVHSLNPVGADALKVLIERYFPHQMLGECRCEMCTSGERSNV